MKRALVGIATLACIGAFASVGLAADCPGGDTGGTGDLGKAKVALHAVAALPGKACAKNAPNNFGCSNAGTSPGLVTSIPTYNPADPDLDPVTPPVNSGFLYMVILDVDCAVGTKGATFGLNYAGYSYVTYSGVYLKPKETCVPQEFRSTSPAWPAPGSGNVMTSVDCIQTVDPADPENECIAVLGILEVFVYDYYQYGTHQDQVAVSKRLYLATPDYGVSNCSAASSTPCFPSSQGAVDIGGGPGYSPCVETTATEATTWGRLKKFKGE